MNFFQSVWIFRFIIFEPGSQIDNRKSHTVTILYQSPVLTCWYRLIYLLKLLGVRKKNTKFTIFGIACRKAAL